VARRREPLSFEVMGVKSIKGSAGESQTLVDRPTRRVAGILGFLQKGEVSVIFQQQPFETATGASPLDLWRDGERARQGLAPVGSATARDLNPSTAAAVEEVKRRSTYKQAYESVADYQFQLVPIDLLLTPQWYADVEYIDEIVQSLKPGMSEEQQLQFAMTEGKITEPIVLGNVVSFTSPRRDLHTSPIPTIRETAEGDFEISLKAGSRPNYVQVAEVAEIGGRLLLTNGVHKVCALYKAGYRECVCLFRKVQTVRDAGFDTNSSTLFSQYTSARPPLVIDLLDVKLASELRMRPLYQVLQVSINVGTTFVPALPDRMNA
jgi:hypothetical protein